MFGRTVVSGAADWVVAGLGNPGAKYEHTRHNVGFQVIDLLSARWGIPVKKLKFQATYGQGTALSRKVLLLKPQTFMNLSGQSVRDCLAFLKLPPERLIVVYDDVALAPGRLRVRAQGSDGGHNGIKNILYHLKTDAFPRVKIGVGAASNPEYALADWVLSRPEGEDAKVIAQMRERAADAVEEIIKNGAESAMNRYNG